MAKIPTSTQTSLWQRLTSHAKQRWPQDRPDPDPLPGGFAYIDAVVANGGDPQTLPTRYGEWAHQWGFASYRASHDDYEDSYLPSATPSAPPNKPSTPPRLPVPGRG